jgi:hypothetical protein
MTRHIRYATLIVLLTSAISAGCASGGGDRFRYSSDYFGTLVLDFTMKDDIERLYAAAPGRSKNLITKRVRQRANAAAAAQRCPRDQELDLLMVPVIPSSDFAKHPDRYLKRVESYWFRPDGSLCAQMSDTVDLKGWRAAF